MQSYSKRIHTCEFAYAGAANGDKGCIRSAAVLRSKFVFPCICYEVRCSFPLPSKKTNVTSWFKTCCSAKICIPAAHKCARSTNLVLAAVSHADHTTTIIRAHYAAFVVTVDLDCCSLAVKPQHGFRLLGPDPCPGPRTAANPCFRLGPPTRHHMGVT